MHNRNVSRGLIVVLFLLLLIACATEERRGTEADPVQAIHIVFAQDDSLGAQRNHAPESMPLSEAIRAYVAGLEAIDYGGCPQEFTVAFRRHREAWERSMPFFSRFDDLRGEMHELFEEIRERDADTRHRLEAAEEEIWGTWDEVEAAARRAGARPEPENE